MNEEFKFDTFELEELTIYVAEQDKKIAEQNKTIERLEKVVKSDE